MGDSQLLVTLGLETSSFSKQMKGVNTELRNLDKQIGLVDKSSDGYGKTLNGVSEKYELQQRKIDAYQTKLNALNKTYDKNSETIDKKKKKLEELSKDYDGNKEEIAQLEKQIESLTQKNAGTAKQMELTSKEMESAEREAKSLETQMKELGKETGTSSTKFEDFSKKLQDIGGKMKDVGGKISDFGKGMTTKVTAPILGGVAAIATLEEKFDKATANIQSGTGATGEKLAGLEQSFKNVYKQVPSDIETVSKSIADLNTALGLEGKPLEDLTKQFMDLSQITGTDVSTNINEITRLFGDWGVEADDMSKTLDFMFKVSQETGMGVDNLGKMATDMGTRFRNAGIPLDEALVLLGNWEKTGVNTEKMMGGMNTALNNLAREGVPDVKQGFKDMIDSIYEAEDEQWAYNEALKYFGADAGPDAFDTIRQGKFNVDDLKDSISGSTSNIKDTAKETMTWSQRMTMLKNELSLALEPLGELVDQYLPSFIEFVKKVIEKISEWAQWFANLDEGSKNLILVFVAFLAALGPVLTVVGTLIGLFGTLSTVAGILGVSVGAVCLPVIAVIAAIAAVIAIGVLLWKNWDTISAKCTEIWGKVKNFFITTFDNIKAKFQDLWSKFMVYWNQYGVPVVNVVLQSWENFKKGVLKVFDMAKEGFSKIWTGMKTVWNATGQKLIDKIVEAFEKMKEGILAIPDKIKKAFSGIMDTAKGLVNGAIGWLNKVPGVNIDKFSLDDVTNKVQTQYESVGDTPEAMTFADGVSQFNTPSLAMPLSAQSIQLSGSYGGSSLIKNDNSELSSLIKELKDIKQQAPTIQLTIENFNNNTANDIENIADELAYLIRQKNIGFGM